MDNISYIYLSGGIGKRADVGKPKQFHTLNGIPMMIYGLLAINQIDEINEVIINYPDGFLDEIKQLIDAYAINKRIIYVEGGNTRQDSVFSMVKKCSNEQVIIHESARPVVTETDFRELINCTFRNVTFVQEIPFTVAVVDTFNSKISQWLDRDVLRNIQLPQKFKRSTLLLAHNNATKKEIIYTEDATMCLECTNELVHFLDGRPTNIKITTKDQFIIADLFLTGIKSGV